MKNTNPILGSATLLGMLLITANTPLRAQAPEGAATTVTTTTQTAASQPALVQQQQTTTVSSTGIIREFSPDTLIIKDEGVPEPVRYNYTKKTTYVDEAGQPVSIETVKSGLPVTIYYTKDGDRMVASRVVVKKIVVAPAAPIIAEKKTTTTTTTESDK